MPLETLTISTMTIARTRLAACEQNLSCPHSVHPCQYTYIITCLICVPTPAGAKDQLCHRQYVDNNVSHVDLPTDMIMDCFSCWDIVDNEWWMSHPLQYLPVHLHDHLNNKVQ